MKKSQPIEKYSQYMGFSVNPTIKLWVVVQSKRIIMTTQIHHHKTFSLVPMLCVGMQVERAGLFKSRTAMRYDCNEKPSKTVKIKPLPNYEYELVFPGIHFIE